MQLTSQTKKIMKYTRPSVLLVAQLMGSWTALYLQYSLLMPYLFAKMLHNDEYKIFIKYRSNAIAHRLRMEAVQQRTSAVSHTLHITGEKQKVIFKNCVYLFTRSKYPSSQHSVGHIQRKDCQRNLEKEIGFPSIKILFSVVLDLMRLGAGI